MMPSRIGLIPRGVRLAALQSVLDHGAHALNSAIEGLLRDLFAG